jgi:5-methylcytosine-specific restriction endonuclease McrA
VPIFRLVKVCRACGTPIPSTAVIDGIKHVLSSRVFCLDCSPFGAHNTSSRTIPDAERRARRLASYVSYSRRRRLQIKRELIAARGGMCEDCGYDRVIGALEFHHRDPHDKSFALGGFHGGIDKGRREAAKCVLVCANCHRRRHNRSKRDGGHPTVRFRQNLKQRAVAAMGGACIGCRLRDPVDALEFHHLDPTTKEFGISTEGIPRRWDKIEAELKKCVLLCANCHREVHAGVRRIGEDEGSYRTCEAATDPLHNRCA